MTVEELRDMLADIPDDAIVMFKQELVGSDHYPKSIEYKDDDYRGKGCGILWIKEI